MLDALRPSRPEAPRQPEAWPPGHFYSPIPSLEEVRRDHARLFGAAPVQLPGVDLRDSEQVALFESLSTHAMQQPWQDEASADRRYHFDNDYFRHGEALVLQGLLCHLRPRRFVEIGSGYSSAAALDVDERFLGGSLECVFVEPDPDRLRQRLRPGDLHRVTLLEHRVQDVDLDVFASLRAGDVLFIDSTHVAKIGSDVNDVFFRVLPVLAAGVLVHFHDVLYPFEYPSTWVLEGRAWNEAYVLRAFLQYNERFQIVFFNSYFFQFHRERVLRSMPLMAQSPGSSLWLRVAAPRG